MKPEHNFHHKVVKRKWVKKVILLLVIIFIIFPLTIFFAFFFVAKPTDNFPVNKYFDIKKGMSVSEVSNFLEREGYIQSALAFNLLDRWEKYNGKVSGPQAGKYIFKKKYDIFDIYGRLNKGVSGIDPVKITFYEGISNYEISEIIEKSGKMKDFDKERFLEVAKNDEGFLYPDTYEFLPFDTEEMMISEMKENFNLKNKKYLKEIQRTNKSLEKIIKMASIIEKEAGISSLEKKRIVAGILWNRIKKGKPLEVDTVFPYIFREKIPRTFFSHTKVDSPYNLYKYKGLPPTAISNPNIGLYIRRTKPNRNKLYFLFGRSWWKFLLRKYFYKTFRK